jgi:hypothetical protein
MAVIIIIAIIAVMVLVATNRSVEKSTKSAFVAEANTISKAALTKYADDKTNKTSTDDIFYGNDLNKVCYNIEDTIIGKYVNKDNGGKYKGSVEVCYGMDCTYNTKIWLTNGEYYVEGVDREVKQSDIKFKFTTDHTNSCGETVMYGGTYCLTDDSEKYCNFEFTGKTQKFVAPYTGNYALEVWGAQGGNYVTQPYYTGGYGGYSYGEINLVEGDEIYIAVGGKGNDSDGKNGHNGFNGGGAFTLKLNSYEACKQGAGGGGGATHIAFSNGLLSELTNKKDYIVIVSGGGAGGIYSGTSGSGGGFNGGADSEGNIRSTQTTGYALGQGVSSGINGCGCNIAAGGGGYYGGASASRCQPYTGNGGSGFINYPQLKNAHMYGYNVNTSNDASTKTLSGTNVSDDPEKDTAKRGDGFAKITYLGE